MNECRICKNTKGNKSHIAREMVLGLGDEFEYVECSKCGCVQIKEIPEDLSGYYTKDYYSFKKRRKRSALRDNFIRSFLKKKRTRNYLGDLSALGRFAERLYEEPVFFPQLKKAKINIDSEILDMGSGGAARFLLKLRREGFVNIEGADPFIDEDVSFGNGIKVYKKYISEIKKQYDLVVMSHTFEHVPCPLDVLRETYRILKPGGYAVVTIPVASSLVFRKYGVNWSGFYAPRHLFLHTPESMRVLVDQTGLLLDDVVFESVGAQFWFSELIERGLPFKDIKADSGIKDRYFTRDELKAFDEMAIKANKNNEGDTAAFYLHKPRNH